MGWVVRDIVQRERAELGVFHWRDWQQCAAKLELRVIRDDAPDALPAVLVGNVIILKAGLPKREAARYAWHEIAHARLHIGTASFWAGRPQGYLVLGKFERHANEFADQFPIWDEGDDPQ